MAAGDVGVAERRKRSHRMVVWMTQQRNVLVLAAIFAAVYVLGMEYGIKGYLTLGPAGLALRIAIMSVVFTVVGTAARTLGRAFAAKDHPILCRVAPTWNRRSVLVRAAAVLAVWAVWLVCFYPGSMGWDTFYQIYQWYPDNHPFTDSITGLPVEGYFLDTNPFFDTLVFGLFAYGSDLLFGWQNYGVFAYVTLQAFGLALMVSVLLASVGKWTDSKTARACAGAALLFVAFFPPTGIFAVTMTKDSLYAVFFLWYLYLYAEVARTKGTALSRRWFIVALTVACVLCSLTKKTGIYLVLLGAVVLLVVLRKQWVPIAVSVAPAALAMWFVLPVVVFPAFDVVQGSSSEVSAIAWQQTARYVTVHGEQISPEDRQAIDDVLRWDTLAERYDPFCNDNVKQQADYEATPEQKAAYWKVWLRQGMSDPVCYLESIACTAAGYFVPCKTISIYSNTGSPLSHENTRISNPAFLEPLRLGATNLYWWAAGQAPTSWLFMICLYSFVIPSLCFAFCVRRFKTALLVLAPIAITLLVCVASPYSTGRYALPLFFVAPYLIALCSCRWEEARR